jgi:hypothetical protein
VTLPVKPVRGKPDTWPEYLRTRPVDIKRKLPVPVSNTFDDGNRVDFTVLNGPLADALASGRFCGLCGKSMGWWVAFIGGSLSFASGQYTNPPMHPECAKAAMSLCPHIALLKTKRAKDVGEATEPEGFSLEKPDKWMMFTTRTYRVIRTRAADGKGVVAVYLSGKPKTVWTFAYQANNLVVVDEHTY